MLAAFQHEKCARDVVGSGEKAAQSHQHKQRYHSLRIPTSAHRHRRLFLFLPEHFSRLVCSNANGSALRKCPTHGGVRNSKTRLITPHATTKQSHHVTSASLMHTSWRKNCLHLATALPSTYLAHRTCKVTISLSYGAIGAIGSIGSHHLQHPGTSLKAQKSRCCCI